jgi:hypothetical protein
MTTEPEDLGDARSRQENRGARSSFDRSKADNPLIGAYVPRWVPTPNWRLSIFDLILYAIGIGIILMVLGMWLLGVVGGH